MGGFTTHRIFTSTAIFFATILGGPISAGFLISRNYDAFNKEKSSQNSLLIGAILTILLTSLGFFMQRGFLGSILLAAIPIAYILFVFLLIEKYQSDQIDHFLENGGEKEPFWKAFLFGFAGTLFTVFLIYIFSIFFTPQVDGFAGKIKVSPGIYLYYQDNIDRKTAQKVAYGLDWSNALEGATRADIFLKKRANLYKLDFVIDPVVLQDSDVVLAYNDLEVFLNKNLSIGKQIKIGFTDNMLDKKYDLTEISLPDSSTFNNYMTLRKHSVSFRQIIYYNDSVPASDIQVIDRTIRKLSSYFPVNVPIDVIFLKIDADYQIKFFVDKKFWKSKKETSRIREVVEYIEYDSGKDIRLFFIDSPSGEEIELRN